MCSKGLPLMKLGLLEWPVQPWIRPTPIGTRPRALASLDSDSSRSQSGLSCRAPIGRGREKARRSSWNRVSEDRALPVPSHPS